MLYATGLNVFISVAEFAGGILSGSIALLSDALHNLGDAFATLIAYLAHRVSKKQSNSNNTYGMLRVEILAALLNAVALIVISIFLFVEAWERLKNPMMVNTKIMLVVAMLGLAANVYALALLHRDSKKSINIKAAYLHLIGDSLSSVVVIIGGILMFFFQIYWIDPIITFLIGIYILKETFSILKESINILMQKTPGNINLDKIKNQIERIEGVKNLHHIHVWALNDQKVYFDSHVDTLNDLRLSEVYTIRKRIEKILHSQFGIDHITLQFEYRVEDDKEMINKEG